MEEKLSALRLRLREIRDLTSVGAVLNWDQSTYMPPGGAAARGRQMALVQRQAHEKQTDPALGQLLDSLLAHGESLPYESDDAALIRVARRLFDEASRIPPDLMADFTEHRSESYHVWTTARPENDFAKITPYLEKMLDYSRKVAECSPEYDHIADPLIGLQDYGMTVKTVSAVFAELRKHLVALVQEIGQHAQVDNTCLMGEFPGHKQIAFASEVIRSFGYDFDRGRIDRTHHPFETAFSIGDVRLTTRVNDRVLDDGIFATMHEAGHGMYEQGVDPIYEEGPLARGTSSGIHESQSRTWENIVGRSLPFWQHYYPALQKSFPGQLDDVSVETFYRAINKVQPSLIRVRADEVTYNLHVMLRFDLELALLEGKLAIKDLPDAWNARFEQDFGITPPNLSDGCMQDVHWYGIRIGGVFQGYTLGNILSAQFYNAALVAHPDIPQQVAIGDFTTLHGWLRENIYRHGRKFTAAEMIQRITGGDIAVQPLVDYLRAKYSKIYGF